MKNQLRSNSSSYILESQDEAVRLETQSELPGYRVKDELGGVSLPKSAKILDAGCGTGLLSRFLLSRFPSVKIDACDFSEIRIKQAQDASKKDSSSIRYFAASLEKIPAADETYDHIFCRYVVEHLPSPVVACQEFYRTLKPGGAVTVIDFDGFFFNFHCENAELMQMLGELRLKMKTPNLFIGREISVMLKGLGFKDVQQKIECITFEGEALEGELKNTEQRLAFAQPIFISIFGSKEKAERFSALYYSEMKSPKTFFFYNKFIVTGKK
jgi:ubiquinone/menaquinone biosynthesis C-methylase UbiE